MSIPTTGHGVSYPTCLTVYFAKKPAARVTVKQCADAWETSAAQARDVIREMCRTRRLIRLAGGRGRGNEGVYGAGPAVLRLIEEIEAA